MGISQYRLAKAIGKPQSAISDIVHGKRSITPEMAWLFGAALGTTPQFWLNLEASYQLKMLEYKGNAGSGCTGVILRGVVGQCER